MTTDHLISLFTKHEDEFLEHDRIASPLSRRADLHAFILLDRLVPGPRDMVAAAEHDQIWLDVSLEDLAASAITEEQVVELVRCGVMVDEDTDSLSMFP